MSKAKYSASCTSYLLIVITTIFGLKVSAQNFVPDKKGYVEGANFKQFIKQNDYQLISAFDTFSRKPLVLAAKVMIHDKWIMIDTQGKLINEEEIHRKQNSYVPFISSGFDLATADDDSFDKDLYTSISINGKYGTVEKTTQKPGLPPVYDGLTYLKGGFIETRVREKIGIALSSGKIIKEPQYEEISPIIYGYTKPFQTFLQVKKDGKYGLLNAKAENILPPVYDKISNCDGCDFKRQLLVIVLDHKFGLATKKGKVVLAPKYSDIKPLTFKGQMLVSIGKVPDIKYGMIDSTGKELLPPVYISIKGLRPTDLLELNAGSLTEPKYGLSSTTGKIVLPPVYQNLSEAERGLFTIRQNGKTGLAGKSGIVVEPLYDQVFFTYTASMIIVRKDRKFGVVGLNGKTIIPLIYDNILAGQEGFAAWKAEQCVLLSPLGKLVKTLSYDSVLESGNYLVVKQNSKYGVIDLGGNVIFPIKYDRFRNASNVVDHGITTAVIEGRDYLVDRYGNEHAR